MADSIEAFYTLKTERSELVILTRSGVPLIVHWGCALSDNDLDSLLRERDTASGLPAMPDLPAHIPLAPELAHGFFGHPAVLSHRNGRDWDTSARLLRVEHDADELLLVMRCDNSQIELYHHFRCRPGSDVIVLQTRLVNVSTEKLSVIQCVAGTLPLPTDCDEVITFTGRWGYEFQTQQQQLVATPLVIENRAGRTSHDHFPGVIIHEPGVNETRGVAYGFHLGWSGNHVTRIESLAIGMSYVQMGELLLPGEIELEGGESYLTPALFAAFSSTGLTDLSRQFHHHMRSQLLSRGSAQSHPVHFNTWEAIYFDHNLSRLTALVDRAAEIGAERFVLDDGWFNGRSTDQTSLGDWIPDPLKYPNGLTPLVDYIRAQDLEFGLWIEPEMVSPKSDLYEAHPDWILSLPGREPALARHQLVLDVQRKEVADYLFSAIDTLLREYDIAYLKWDMNRAIHQSSNYRGRASVSAHTRAVYRLMARVRAAHPEVVIESCASGGGRADFGVLDHTDRIWISDSNDALDRVRIQSGFSYFFPAQVMGSHVGPKICHLTGREIDIVFRAGVALAGHMGIECDLTDCDARELRVLTQAVSVYKSLRMLSLSGDSVRLDLARYEIGSGVVAPDRTEALFSYALLDSAPGSLGRRLKLSHLDLRAKYLVELLWPLEGEPVTACEPLIGRQWSAEFLQHKGLPLPPLKPQTLLIFGLRSSKD